MNDMEDTDTDMSESSCLADSPETAMRFPTTQASRSLPTSILNGAAQEFVPASQGGMQTQTDPFRLFGSTPASQPTGAQSQALGSAQGHTATVVGNAQNGSGMGGSHGSAPGYAAPATYLHDQSTAWPMSFPHQNYNMGYGSSNQAPTGVYVPGDCRNQPTSTAYPTTAYYDRPSARSQFRAYEAPPTEEETLAATRAKERGLALRAALEAAQQALLTLPTPTPPIRPFTCHSPLEMWLKIASQFLVPRVLTIIKSGTGHGIRLAPCLERIPPPLFVDIATRKEALKNHTIAFRDLLDKPVLFNSNADILLFANTAALFRLTKLPKAFDLMRAAHVRFIAIDYTEPSITLPAGSAAQDHGSPATIAEAVRMFGSIEKIFLVFNVTEPEEYRKTEAEAWKTGVRDKISDKFEKARPIWEAFEVKGRAVNKWRKPDAVDIVWDEDVLLRLANRREKTAEDEKSDGVEGGEGAVALGDGSLIGGVDAVETSETG